MGCICGKPLVKASINKSKLEKEKVKESQREPDNINNSNPPLQETSNESDRILIDQNPVKKPKREKSYEFPRKTLIISSQTQIKTRDLPPSPSKSIQTWTQLIKSHKNSLVISLKPVKAQNKTIENEWDKSFILEMTQKILQLEPRDWVSEQIYLMNKSLKKGKKELKEKNKILQLKYQFQWLLWAVRNVWVVYMNGKSSKVGQDFMKLTGFQCELPQSGEEWFSGFEFKNVRFWVVLRGTESAKSCKNEIKAMKQFYLDSLFSDKLLVFPSIHCVTAGLYLVFAMPVYPDILDPEPNGLDLVLMSRPKFSVPVQNIFRLKSKKKVFLLQNFLSFSQNENKRSVIALFDSSNSQISLSENTYETSISKKEIVNLLYPEGQKGSISIKQSSFNLYGWNCVVFWDSNSKSSNSHKFSMFFDMVKGNFLVFFNDPGLKPKRQVESIEGALKDSIEFKVRVKDCVNELERKEAINSQEALEELIHRKGLRNFHQWIVYSKCRSKRTYALLEASLLGKAVKKLVLAESIGNDRFKAKEFNGLVAKVANSLLQAKADFCESNRKVAFVLFVDRLFAVVDMIRMKNLGDVSSSRIIDPIPNKTNSSSFFKTSEIIEKILTCPSRHPKSFFLSLEHQLNIKLDRQLLIKSGNDPHTYLKSPVRFTADQILSFTCKFSSLLSLQEETYLELISLNSKLIHLDDLLSSGNDSQILLFHKESELATSELILPGDLYSKNLLFFNDNYPMPSVSTLESWLSLWQEIYFDVVTPDGSESVVLEILIKVIQIHTSSYRNQDLVQNYLNMVNRYLDESIFVTAESVISYYMCLGLNYDKVDPSLAEQSYITALLLLTRLYGDPRGRNNIGVPWQMTAAWKLSKLSREEKRIQDAQLAEEHFDSIFVNTSSFIQNSQKKYSRSSVKQQASIYSSPFEVSKEPLWEEILAWIVNNCINMYSTGEIWSRAQFKEFVKLTQLAQIQSQMANTSGASTPSSNKESKRVNHQNSLSQAILMQEFAVSIETAQGLVFVWGSDTEGQLGISIDSNISQVQLYPRMLTYLKDFVVTEIAAGALHSVAVTLEGLCFAWGNNECGQLGLGPDLPKIISSPVHVKAINHVKSAACGYQHSIFLTFSGQILTCGQGEGGVLGHSNIQSCSYPKTILNVSKINFSSITSGAYHSLAVTSSGHLFVWGRGEGGQLGLDPEELCKSSDDIYMDSPSRVLGALSEHKLIQSACGEAHSLALTSSGKVFAWGWGSNGQLGNGYREEDFEEAGNLLSIQYNPTPVIAFSFPIKQIAAGGLFSMFLSEENEIYICGANDKKQLGLEGHTKDVAIPTKIECFTGYPIENIACGESHCVAVAPKLVWTWGNHLDHRLGLGEVNSFMMPRPLQSLTNANVRKVSCGRMHSMAVVASAASAREQLEGLYEEFDGLEVRRELSCWRIEF